MRTIFPEYYPPEEKDFSDLWREATIVLDANVLLNLYRLPQKSREEFLKVIEQFSDRLWLPFHAALEFQRNRVGVMLEKEDAIESFSKKTKDHVPNIRSEFQKQEAAKNILGVDEAALLNALESAYANIEAAASKNLAAQKDLYKNDSIRAWLDEKLSGKIGSPPKTKAEVDALIEGADERYKYKVPPGYMDSSKAKDGEPIQFYHGSLKYEARHGDLILWRQLLAHCTLSGVRAVILVTDDTKEDWWLKVRGRTVGPHPALIEEIRRVSNVNLFWMYSSLNFLKNAAKYKHTAVSDETLTEVEDAVRIMNTPNRVRETLNYDTALENFKSYLSRATRISPKLAELAIYSWASREYRDVIYSAHFPDFIGRDQEGKLVGIEAKYFPNFSPSALEHFSTSLRKGWAWQQDNEPASFILAVATEKPSPKELGMIDMVKATNDLVDSIPTSTFLSVVLGEVGPDGQFVPWLHIAND